MFAKNSRYASLPGSSPVNANGERLLGTNLRLIAATDGTFLHTVLARDRLDLLALKYYGDPTRWWQISDANPEFPFPLDLLDKAPIHEETLRVVNPDLQARFDELTVDLTTAGEIVRFPRLDLSTSSVVLLGITPATRTQSIAAIEVRGFHFLNSFAWSDGVATNEIFYFEDEVVKASWRSLLDDLGNAPGILRVLSAVEDGTVRLVYNTEVMARDRILALVNARGFEVVPQESQEIRQRGAQIVIPPNSVS